MSHPKYMQAYVFRKYILVTCLVYDKPPKNENGHGIPDDDFELSCASGILGHCFIAPNLPYHTFPI